MEKTVSKRVILIILTALILLGGMLLYRVLLQKQTSPQQKDNSGQINHILNNPTTNNLYRLNGLILNQESLPDGILEKLAIQATFNHSDIQLHQQMISVFSTVLSRPEYQSAVTIPYDKKKNQQLLEMMTNPATSHYLTYALAQHAGASAKWQQHPLPNAEYIATQLSQKKHHLTGHLRLVEAITNYAKYYPLPAEILDPLVSTSHQYNYSKLKMSTLKAFEYQALHGQLDKKFISWTKEIFLDKKTPYYEKESAADVLVIVSRYDTTLKQELEKILNDKNTDINISGQVVNLKLKNVTTEKELLAIANGTLEHHLTRNAAIVRLANKKTGTQHYPNFVIDWLADENANIRYTTAHYIYNLLENYHPDHHDKMYSLLQPHLNDVDQKVRNQVLSRVLSLNIADDIKITLLQNLLNSPDHLNRGSAASLTNLLLTRRIPEEKVLPLISQALHDSHPYVVTKAMKVIRFRKLNNEDLISHTRTLTRHNDPGISKEARITIDAIEKRQESKISKLGKALSEPDNYGQLLFFFIAFIAYTAAFGFALYFIIMIIVQLVRGSGLSLVNAISLVIWLGLTGVMVSIFFIGAFSFGHNTLVANKTQYGIDLTMAIATLAYVAAGVFMAWLGRRKKTTVPG